MNLKRTFGAALTILGICGLIYAAILFMNTKGAGRDLKGAIVFGVLGLIFFASGMGLIKRTADEG